MVVVVEHKLSITGWANASAVVVGFVYAACALSVALFPVFFKVVATSWFHGIDLEAVWTGAPRGNFILGLVTATAGSWLVGYIFAWSYNKFVK